MGGVTGKRLRVCKRCGEFYLCDLSIKISKICPNCEKSNNPVYKSHKRMITRRTRVTTLFEDDED